MPSSSRRKVFVISLPRTGTTSACICLLNGGFKVAHTAYSQATYTRADVIADTPVFVDYPSLIACYPGARCVYLVRPQADWVLSIRRLLHSMRKQWARDHTVFESEIKRCFQAVFPGFERKTAYSDTYLLERYKGHQDEVQNCFAARPEQLLELDITGPDAGRQLLAFCRDRAEIACESVAALPHVNRGRRITYWESVTHNNKIPSRF